MTLPAAIPSAVSFSPQQCKIIHQTVAKDTNQVEFDLFMETSRLRGLNPMTKQIYAMVYNKDDDKKRRMVIHVGIDGLRVLARRCGDYRPDDEEADFLYDENKKGPDNPTGLVRATVKVFQQDNRGEWFPIRAAADWDEFAATVEEGENFTWEDIPGQFWEDSGKPKRRKVFEGETTRKVDPKTNWATMPRVMLAKCAEARALRKGWPEQTSGLYEPAEGMVIDADFTASEAVDAFTEDLRKKRIGMIGGEFAMVFDMDSGAIEMVPPGQMYDRCAGHVKALESPMGLRDFQFRNAETLKRFWAEEPDAALSLKQAMEKRAEQLSQVEAA